MLPRELRLKERRRFQAVYRRGRSWANPEMVVHVLRQPSSERQFGFVVSKKLGGAVQRNRVRRLLREACRALVSGVDPGLDVVIVARPAAREASLARLTEGMRDLFLQARIWTDAAASEIPGPARLPKPLCPGASPQAPPEASAR